MLKKSILIDFKHRQIIVDDKVVKLSRGTDEFWAILRILAINNYQFVSIKIIYDAVYPNSPIPPKVYKASYFKNSISGIRDVIGSEMLKYKNDAGYILKLDDSCFVNLEYDNFYLKSPLFITPYSEDRYIEHPGLNNNIRQQFKSKNICFIRGTSGVGKTEAARRYIMWDWENAISEDIKKHYIYYKVKNNKPNINDFLESILYVCPENESYSKDALCELKKSHIRMQLSHCVIVVDGYNTHDNGFLSQLRCISRYANIIITSQITADCLQAVENSFIVDMDNIYSKENLNTFATAVFCKYGNINDINEVDTIKKIVGLLGCHTYACAIVASQYRIHNLNLKNVCAKLEKSLSEYIKEDYNVYINKDGNVESGSVYQLIDILFDKVFKRSFTDMERRIIGAVKFLNFRNVPCKREHIISLLGDALDDTLCNRSISNLVDENIIRSDGNHSLIIHPLMWAFLEEKDLVEFSPDFICHMMANELVQSDCHPFEYFADRAIDIAKMYPGETVDSALEKFFSSVSDKNKGWILLYGTKYPERFRRLIWDALLSNDNISKENLNLNLSLGSLSGMDFDSCERVEQFVVCGNTYSFKSFTLYLMVRHTYGLSFFIYLDDMCYFPFLNLSQQNHSAYRVFYGKSTDFSFEQSSAKSTAIIGFCDYFNHAPVLTFPSSFKNTPVTEMFLNEITDHNNVIEKIYMPDNLSFKRDLCINNFEALRSVFFGKNISRVNAAFSNCPLLSTVILPEKAVDLTGLFIPEECSVTRLFIPHGSKLLAYKRLSKRHLDSIMPIIDGVPSIRIRLKGQDMTFRYEDVYGEGVNNNSKICDIHNKSNLSVKDIRKIHEKNLAEFEKDIYLTLIYGEDVLSDEYGCPVLTDKFIKKNTYVDEFKTVRLILSTSIFPKHKEILPEFDDD